MAKSGKELTPAQKRAIGTLLTSRNVTGAAEAAGVGDRTLRRWLEDDDFVGELRKAEDSVIDQAVRRLLHFQEAAMAVVVQVMADREVSPSVRVKAATVILEQLIKVRELRNTEARLSALEEAIAGMGA